MGTSVVVPGYELLEPCGGRGAISVFRARDRSSGRVCELNLLRVEDPAAPEEEDRQLRFLDEGRQYLGFDHPNVVRILDVGAVPGSSWIAQEQVEGLTLDEVLERHEGPLGLEATLAIGAQVGSALGALGLRDLVHRDVSPKAIVITADGTARLTGFGLTLESSYERLSQGELPSGGVDFLSPEQVEGELLLTPKADVYGLGATLYRCLAGRVPHGGLSLFTRLRAIAHSQTADVRELNPAVPDALAQLLGRFMEWDPDDRPLSQDVAPFLLQVAVDTRGQADGLHAALSEVWRSITGSSAPGKVGSDAITVRLRGTDRTLDLPLRQGESFNVGRAHDAAVSLRFGWVSRQHARVERRVDDLVLTDLGSANGTTHNMTRVHGSVALANGDMVSFGKSSFQVLLLEGDSHAGGGRRCALCGQDLDLSEDDEEVAAPVCLHCQVRSQADREASMHRVRRVLEEARFEIEEALDTRGVFKRFRVRRRKKAFLVSAIEVGQRTARSFSEGSTRALSLKHPGVLPAVDLDVRSGALIVVSQAHPGRTLEDLVETEGPLPPEAIVSLGQLLCETLAHVLGQGIPHTLVRPEMVLLADDGQPVILDAGLAPGLVDAARAYTGWAAAPCYEAPELEEARDLTPQGVVYSLGATLSYALTGSPVAETRGGERYDHLPLTMVASIPESLAALLSQATAPDPSDRPASPVELGEALGALDLAEDGDDGPLLRPEEQTWPSGDKAP